MRKYEFEIITGSLLSDGCVTKPKRCVNYHWSQTCIYLEYIEYLKEELSFITNVTHVKPKTSVYPNGKIYTNKECWHLRTRTCNEFSDLRKIWYPSGIKTVPHDLEITPTVLLHWYLGDGYIHPTNGIFLCTDTFDAKDVLRLAKKMSCHFETNLIEKSNRIHIPNRAVWEYFQFIGDPPVECFAYKWDTNVRQSYLNRTCICGTTFDAVQNHQTFCSAKCCTRSWRAKKCAIIE